MMQPMVTILIPHYKTLELTKLCLRLIRKHTDLNKAHVIVIDNDSQDASLDYLRTVSWIQLIERKGIAHESAILSHSRALDLGLESVTTPYVLSIHTDTLVKHSSWLEFLLSIIEKNSNVAGVGSWKLESKPWWRQLLKTIERRLQLGYHQVSGQVPERMEGIGKNHYYLRSHCALYRVELFKKLDLSFSSGDAVAGKDLHRRLVSAGHEMVFLPSHILIHYLEHINHATTVLNPELSTRAKSIHKGLHRIKQSLSRLNAESILLDVNLDH